MKTIKELAKQIRKVHYLWIHDNHSWVSKFGDKTADEECIELIEEWLKTEAPSYGRCNNCGDEGDIRNFVYDYHKNVQLKLEKLRTK